MRIINKEYYGLIFKRYFFHLEDHDDSLTEISVERNIWDDYEIGDSYDVDNSVLEKLSKKSWWVQ